MVIDKPNQKILDIDPNAFFLTHDCYEVLGGNNKRILNLD